MAPSRYHRFTRDEWARLRADTALSLTEHDLARLRGLNDRVSLDEVTEIYLPLSRLINLHIGASQAGSCNARASPKHVTVPIYSHLTYDIVPGQFQMVDQPEVLIVEGLNILQAGDRSSPPPQHLFASDFFDFTVYVDAEVGDIRRWYIERFFALHDAETVAASIWHDINEPNLLENILPTRERAHLVLEKAPDHSVRNVRLQKR